MSLDSDFHVHLEGGQGNTEREQELLTFAHRTDRQQMLGIRLRVLVFKRAESPGIQITASTIASFSYFEKHIF